MKKSSFISLLIILIISLNSCSFYNPISTNVPSYEKKGEVNAGVNLGTSADVQLSTNPINHLSIIGTASTSGAITNDKEEFSNSPDSLDYKFNRYQFELGLGYYYMLTEKIQHDIHLGYGMGSAAKKEYFYSDESAYQADFNNLFIQSSLIIELDQDIKGYLSSKFNYLTMSNFEHANHLTNHPNYSLEQNSYRGEGYWLNQFSLGLIVDLGPLQLSAQGQLNFRFTNNLITEERPLGLYAGVNFNIAEIINPSKNK